MVFTKRQQQFLLQAFLTDMGVQANDPRVSIKLLELALLSDNDRNVELRRIMQKVRTDSQAVHDGMDVSVAASKIQLAAQTAEMDDILTRLGAAASSEALPPVPERLSSQ